MSPRFPPAGGRPFELPSHHGGKDRGAERERPARFRTTCLSFFVLLLLFSVTMLHEPRDPVVKPVEVDALVYLMVFSGPWPVDVATAVVRSAQVWGEWDKDIYILTNDAAALAPLVDRCGERVKLVSVAEGGFTSATKALKARVMDHLPESVGTALYLDSDIIVHDSIVEFLTDARSHLEQHRGTPVANFHARDGGEEYVWDLALFPDALAHAAKWCAGCDTWHTGVLLLRRGKGRACLEHWAKAIEDGVFDSDQAAMDYVQSAFKDACVGMAALPPQHLLFMKDVIAMTMRRENTFMHFTGLLRREGQSWVYQRTALDGYLDKYIVPKLLAARP